MIGSTSDLFTGNSITQANLCKGTVILLQNRLQSRKCMQNLAKSITTHRYNSKNYRIGIYRTCRPFRPVYIEQIVCIRYINVHFSPVSLNRGADDSTPKYRPSLLLSNFRILSNNKSISLPRQRVKKGAVASLATIERANDRVITERIIEGVRGFMCFFKGTVILLHNVLPYRRVYQSCMQVGVRTCLLRHVLYRKQFSMYLSPNLLDSVR